MQSHRFQRNFASLKGLPQNLKSKTGFCTGYFRGEVDPPPPWFFLVLTEEIASK